MSGEDTVFAAASRSRLGPQAQPVPACVVAAANEANRWKTMDGARNPKPPQVDHVHC